MVKRGKFNSTAFKKDSVYLNEAKEIDSKLNSSLPKDDKEWWKK